MEQVSRRGAARCGSKCVQAVGAESWVQILPLPLINCTDLGQFLVRTVPQLNRDNTP